MAPGAGQFSKSKFSLSNLFNKGGRKIMKTPNYHDFYQKALLPIGVNDLLALQESEHYRFDSSSTHWLIAVEGVQLPQPKIYYHWKVSIYPADAEGDFNWRKPFYCSQAMESMDIVNNLAMSFVQSSKLDQLSSLNLQEKIS
jgi:hypothetical protein